VEDCACDFCLRAKLIAEEKNGTLVHRASHADRVAWENTNSRVSDDDSGLMRKAVSKTVCYLLNLRSRKLFVDRQRD